MTRILSTVAILGALIFSSSAFAFQADHFKGAYEVISEANPFSEAEKKYVICDVDTVANIWAKYAEGDLPPDLHPIKDKASILLGFTFRSGIFFNLEANALIGADMLAMPGAKTDRLQLKRRADNTFELAVRINDVVNFYNLGPRIPLGRITGSTKALIPPLKID